jgi:hypothetical protein
MRTPGSAEAKINGMQEAIKLADMHGNVRAGMSARLALVELCVFNGRHDETLVNFAWCIAQCEADLRIFEIFQRKILWTFKWVLGAVPNYATISRAQIEKTFGQMVAYYDRAGVSHRSIHGLRANADLYLGDREQLAGHRDAWLAAPKDGLQDCPACEASLEAELFLENGQLEQALEAAGELIAGRVGCAKQPELTDAQLLVPLFRRGDLELAQRLQRRSFENIRSNREYFTSMGRYLAYFAATDQQARGVDMLEAIARELPYVRRGFDRLAGLRGAIVFLRRLRDAGHEAIKLRIPPEVPIWRQDGHYSIDKLVEWFNGETVQIAAEFDRRNGNTQMSASLGEYDDLLNSVRPVIDSPAEPSEQSE